MPFNIFRFICRLKIPHPLFITNYKKDLTYLGYLVSKRHFYEKKKQCYNKYYLNADFMFVVLCANLTFCLRFWYFSESHMKSLTFFSPLLSSYHLVILEKYVLSSNTSCYFITSWIMCANEDNIFYYSVFFYFFFPPTTISQS